MRLIAILFSFPALLFVNNQIANGEKRYVESDKSFSNCMAFEKGYNSLQKDSLNQAYKAWEVAYTDSSYIKECGIDPQIGFEYIKSVTKERAYEKYEFASFMYFEAFKGEFNEKNSDVFEDEEIRLETIFDNVKIRPEGREQIVSQWNTLDPTPSTLYNERLLEHWERLNKVFERYEGWSSVEELLENDDRAKLYVRLGEPTDIKEGILTIDYAQLRSLIERKINSFPNLSSVNNLDNFVNEGVIRQLESRTINYHQDTFYEVWQFSDDYNANQSSLYIFSSINGRRFEAKGTIDELIPAGAFSLGARNRNFSILENQNNNQLSNIGSPSDLSALISPAILLQNIYYEELAAFDETFGLRYSEIFRAYTDDITNVSTSDALIFKQSNTIDFKRKRDLMPLELSDYEDEMLSPNLKVYPYKFIREKKHVTVFFLFSEFFEEYYIISSSDNLNSNSVSYRMENSINIYDKNWNRKSIKVDSNPEIVYNLSDSELYAETVFTVPFNPDDNIKFSSVFINDLEDADKRESVFSENIKLIESIPSKHPKNTLSLDEFEVSDILIGVSPVISDTIDIPISVRHSKEIKKGENLSIYFEVYDPKKNATESKESGFTATIQIEELKRRSIFKRKQYKKSIRLNIDFFEEKYASPIEIETSEYSVGDYRLIFTIDDKNSEKSINRSIEFKIE